MGGNNKVFHLEYVFQMSLKEYQILKKILYSYHIIISNIIIGECGPVIFGRFNCLVLYLRRLWQIFAEMIL